MALNLEKNLKSIGINNMSKEGLNDTDWVLLDIGDIIIHLFKQEIREFYNLEKMWGQNLDFYEKNNTIVYV